MHILARKVLHKLQLIRPYIYTCGIKKFQVHFPAHTIICHTKKTCKRSTAEICIAAHKFYKYTYQYIYDGRNRFQDY